MKRNIIFVLLTFSFVLPLAAQDTIRRADPWYYSEEGNPLKEIYTIFPLDHWFEYLYGRDIRWFYADTYNDDFFRGYVVPENVEHLYGIAVTAFNFPVDQQRIGMTPVMGVHVVDKRFSPGEVLLRIYDSLSVNNLRKDCYFVYELDGATPDTDIVVPTTELYFDIPHRMDSLPDTFYLSLCWENGRKQRYIDWVRAQCPGDSVKNCVFNPQIALYPNFSPAPFFYSEGRCGTYDDYYNFIPSTSYNYVCIYTPTWDSILWGFLFPIVKLRCTAPRIKAVGYGEEAATVSWWQAEAGERYQLSLASYGANPDSGTMVSTTDTFYTFTSLEPDVIYQAWVRKACRYTTSGYDTVVWSDWSHPTTFRTAVGISAVEGYAAFSLSPNPAHGSVQLTLEQAAEGAALTLCDLEGRELRHERVTGASHTLDISALPAGAYVLKLTTLQGVATRRLLVE